MGVLGRHDLDHLGEAQEVVVDVQIVVFAFAAEYERLVALRANVQHELHAGQQSDRRGRGDGEPPDLQDLLRLDPDDDGGAGRNADDAAPAARR